MFFFYYLYLIKHYHHHPTELISESKFAERARALTSQLAKQFAKLLAMR